MPNGGAKGNGIALGIEAADAVIDEREGDGFPDEAGTWRPFTGIREAATDGNPNTAPDPTWTNLLDGAAPPHPSFPSAQASITCSALQVLRKTFGNNTTFQITSDLGPPDESAARTFNTFSSACDDVANSRLWLGFHWRFDINKGKQQGINIGNHADANFLGRTKRTRPQ